MLLLLAACARGGTFTPIAASVVRPSATASSQPSATPVPSPVVLTLCLADEPQSLYLYARPEPGRAHLLAPLYDGPIDYHDFRYEPVLLTKLPSLAEGDALINTVAVNEGDPVVDELNRVVPLEQGVTVNLPGGGQTTYSGEGPLDLPQMAVTFHLRPGVLWSDGTPLTASDSQYSFEIASGPDAYDPRRAVAERTASYFAMDEARVVWTGLPGYLDPLYFTNFWTPLPHHLYGALEPNDVGANEDVNRRPMGWGPYVLTEWVAGDHLTFERNPNYFRAAEGLPRLDRLIYRLVPDPAQIAADLRAGRCDLAPSSSSLESAAGAWDGGDAVLELTAGDVLAHLDFGIAPAGDYTRPVGNDFFADARARQAVASCLNRLVLAPVPSPAGSEGLPAAFLPPGHPLAAAAAPNSFDPGRGRALLADLGWTDADGDGVLDRGGVPLALTLAGAPGRDDLLAQLQAQLKTNCGIETKLYSLTRGEVMGDWPDSPIFSRRFDLALFDWSIGAVPPCELFTTAQLAGEANPGGANDTGYSNPEFDGACFTALTTFDPAPAAQLHAQAQRIFARDLPMLPLFFYPKVAAAGPQVQGYVLDASSESELWNIESLTVAP